MRLSEALPDEYVFTEEDFDAHMSLWKKEFVDNQELTPEEEDFYHMVDEAHRMKCHIGRWPTMGELRQHWKEKDAKQK